MIRAVFPGSFDPLTNGHTDIVRRALTVFDEVVVAVLQNDEKKTIFTATERLGLIRDEFKDLGARVRAESFSGLLVDFVRAMQAQVVLRGLRAISDYDYEAQMALMNKNLSDNKIETLFLMTSEKSSYISSSLVRQVAKFNGDVSKLVPDGVRKALQAKYKI